MKQTLVKLGVWVLLALTMLWFLYSIFNIANGGIGRVPKDGDVISQKFNICIHTQGNYGSGDWIDVFTYHCDKQVDWNSPDNGFESYRKQGMTGYQTSGECVDIDVKDEGEEDSKILYFRKTFACKFFNVNSSEEHERKFKVNQLGELVKI